MPPWSDAPRCRAFLRQAAVRCSRDVCPRVCHRSEFQDHCVCVRRISRGSEACPVYSWKVMSRSAMMEEIHVRQQLCGGGGSVIPIPSVSHHPLRSRGAGGVKTVCTAVVLSPAQPAAAFGLQCTLRDCRGCIRAGRRQPRVRGGPARLRPSGALPAGRLWHRAPFSASTVPSGARRVAGQGAVASVAVPRPVAAPFVTAPDSGPRWGASHAGLPSCVGGPPPTVCSHSPGARGVSGGVYGDDVTAAVSGGGHM